MARETFANAGRNLVELAHLPKLRREDLPGRVTIEGLDALEAARKSAPHGGALLLAAHYGVWELCASAVALSGVPVTVVYRELRNPLLLPLVQEWRESAGIELLPLGSAARGALRALRAGRCVAMAMDQDSRRSEGVFVPFFGRPACTRAAPAKLAMRTGVPVVPVFIRWEGLDRHRIRFQPPVELVPEGEDREAAVVENTRRLNAVLEDAIRAAPDHWIWFHRRWRTTPERGGNPYRALRRRPRLRESP